MKTIKVEGLTTSVFLSIGHLGVAGMKDGILTLASNIVKCRAWVGDSMFTIKSGSTYKGAYQLPAWYNFKGRDSTYIIMCGDINIIKEDLHHLHEREKKAKVVLTQVYATQNPKLFLFKGSSFWKKNVWSYMLYSFYVRQLTYGWRQHDNLLWESLDYEKNEGALLSKVKIRTEIFSPKVFGKNLDHNVHSFEGFAEICNGNNPPMAALLGTTSKQTAEQFYKKWSKHID